MSLVPILKVVSVLVPKASLTLILGDITSFELKPGMYVRVPIDDTEATSLPGEFRDFCLAQVIELPTEQKTVMVQFFRPQPDHQLQPGQGEVQLQHLRRCAVPAQASFIHCKTHKRGRVLIPCQWNFVSGQYQMYYAQVGDEVQIISEAEMCVAENEQSPDPCQQLLDYEFHSPVWKFKRDQLVEGYAELQTATYGIEELVGARIMLLSHQAETIARVLGDRTCRYLLADEVGLGKTIEACVILKGLRRRLTDLKALIIAPSSLIRQWCSELSLKFWLEFPILQGTLAPDFKVDGPGLIISHEALSGDTGLWAWLQRHSWDLMIVDEAHNLRKQPILYERVHSLSKQIERVLLLSATPVQRRADEYLQLLKLMHPAHYDLVNEEQFGKMLETQGIIRQKIAYLARALTPSDFDFDEFQEEMEPVLGALSQDSILKQLATKVKKEDRDRGLQAAIETLQYISHNYRIESRVIRNRRASLQLELPVRRVSTEYAYTPDTTEAEVFTSLQNYVTVCLNAHAGATSAITYGYTLFQAAASSPMALLDLLQARRAVMNSSTKQHQLGGLQAFDQEDTLLERLIWQVQRWEEETVALLSSLPQRTTPPDLPHRLVQVLRAIYQVMRQPSTKILVFSAWTSTLHYLDEKLSKIYGRQALAQFNTAFSAEELQANVDRFQSEEQCRIMLTDESGGEGRNFQIADIIVHVDLPWTPAQIEQRIGRVDRLGRTGEVLSIVPYAQNTIEADLFQLWQQAFALFEASMSGLEIVLEDVQNQIAAALVQSVHTGLAELLPSLIRSAQELREAVEEERYFEEGAINQRLRQDFDDIGERYRDGEVLREALLSWATLAGLSHHYNPKTHVVRFDPKEFNQKSLHNAGFINPPDMREALRRSGRIYNLVINGTFDRDLAVRREDFVFFAPGEVWTDTILNNALQAGRGRCCAIQRNVPDLQEEWRGFALFFRLMVDLRPLYAAGFHPSHLLRAQGYLYSPTHTLYVGADGNRKPPKVVVQSLKRPFHKEADLHLGQRSGAYPPLRTFKEMYPLEEWVPLVTRTLEIAEKALADEFAFMQEHAEEAAMLYAQNAAGQRAAKRWLTGQEDVSHAPEILEYEAISQALVAGIARPLWQLESVCFWILKAGTHAR